MLANNSPSSSAPSSEPFSCLETSNNNINRRKRRPAGTPDTDAEVVSLSPKTLLESDRYVCEICNQGFQRDQNLQMHRRRHKVPWKLLKRETPAVKKRVFVCPEPTCLHHDPCHALGDLVGIKKHFRRKHSNHKQWVCHKCSKECSGRETVTASSGVQRLLQVGTKIVAIGVTTKSSATSS